MHLQDVIVPHLSNVKQKKTAWATWSIYPEVSEAFVFMLENTFAQTDCISHFFLPLERFTVLLL